MEYKIAFPQKIAVTDYHEFRCVKNYMRQFGIPIEIEEIGLIGRTYVGVAYITKDKDTTNLITDLRIEVQLDEIKWNQKMAEVYGEEKL